VARPVSKEWMVAMTSNLECREAAMAAKRKVKSLVTLLMRPLLSHNIVWSGMRFR
jgi:hypothetical protein